MKEKRRDTSKAVYWRMDAELFEEFKHVCHEVSSNHGIVLEAWVNFILDVYAKSGADANVLLKPGENLELKNGGESD